MEMASFTLLYPLALTLLLTLTLLGDRTHLLSSCLAALIMIMVFSHSSFLHPSSSFSFFPQALGLFLQVLGFASEGFLYTRTRSKHRGEV